MVTRSEGYFRGKNDAELFYQSWSSGSSNATLVVTHGLGEHSECYNRLATGLMPASFDVYAWDLRGHGRSEGRRGVVNSFIDFSEDLKYFVEFLKKHRNGPVVLLGHSLGGLVTAATLVKHGDLGAKGLALSSPLFGVAVQVPKLKEKMGRALASVLPNLTLHNEVHYDVLTHDADVIDEYEKDVLRHDRISTQLFVQMMETIDYVNKNEDRIKLPLFVQQAGDDRIVSRKATEIFFEKSVSSPKEIKIYEDSFHEIFNDVGRDSAYADLKIWLKNYLG